MSLAGHMRGAIHVEDSLKIQDHVISRGYGAGAATRARCSEFEDKIASLRLNWSDGRTCQKNGRADPPLPIENVVTRSKRTCRLRLVLSSVSEALSWVSSDLARAEVHASAPDTVSDRLVRSAPPPARHPHTRPQPAASAHSPHTYCNGSPIFSRVPRAKYLATDKN